jgi:hypothetical protein
MSKSLLKKIQGVLGESAGSYCGCFNDYVNRTIENVYAGKPSTAAHDEAKLPKGFCNRCRKPVNTALIDNFNANLAMILPAYENYEIQMPVNVGPTFSDGAARFVRKVGEIPAGMLSRSEVALRLEIKAGDVERHIRSGRLQTDSSKRFVTQDSFDELKVLIRQRNDDM